MHPEKRYPSDRSLVDRLKKPVRCLLSAGNAYNTTLADPLLASPEVEKVVADKAYDSWVLIEMFHDHGAQAVIPPHANSQHPREFDPQVYKARNLVERFFSPSNSSSVSLRATINWMGVTSRS